MTLKGLSEEDMYRILTEPVTNLIRQQIEMLKVRDDKEMNKNYEILYYEYIIFFITVLLPHLTMY